MKIGIVGCGGIARAHIKSFVLNDEVNELILLDVDPEQARAAQDLAKHKARIVINIEEIAEHADAFVVCTPNNLHYKVIAQIVSHKKIPFLCEKPLASSLEEALKIKRIAPKNSIVGFNYRYNRVFKTIKNYIDNNNCGECLHFSGKFNKNSALVRKEITWRDTAEQLCSSGALGDLSCHLIDFFCWATRSPINLPTVRIAKGTRIKQKKDKPVHVDDHGYFFGMNEKGTPFKIKSSKSEKEENLGLYIDIIFEHLKIKYSTKHPERVSIHFMDDVKDVKINMDPAKIIPDPERELPFWADSFIDIHQDWLATIKGASPIHLPYITDGIQVQQVLAKLVR